MTSVCRCASGCSTLPGKQDLLIFTLSVKDRYETANYPNVFIPTNIDVKDETRHAFGAFYASLFDATLEKAGNRAVVTEYAWESRGCDPCPTPPLASEDIFLLGGDALLGMRRTESTDVFGNDQPVVLTRLHARYDASTLNEDLVFRAAPPVEGGREAAPGKPLATDASPAHSNRFQARYAIRHSWTGPILCAEPRRGVWGAPPNEPTSAAVAATNLAAAKRDRSFRQFAVSRVDHLGVAGPPPGVATGSGALPLNYFFLGLLIGAVPLFLVARATSRPVRHED